MPILDPGRRKPEVVQAVDLDLSQERPTAKGPLIDQVRLDVNTPVARFKVIAIGRLVAPAVSYLMVVGAAVSIGYMTNRLASQVVALGAMIVAFFSGLAFVDRWRGK